MQVYSLEIEDFSNDNYSLIGIHTTVEDYQLAFLLNKYLKTCFKRSSNDLDVTNKNKHFLYSTYEYINKAEGCSWFLISNIFKTQAESIGLFNESEIKTFLIPEKKRVDYFLKLEGTISTDYIVKSIEKINRITQVITSYQIEANKLKSKEFLIF